MNDLFASRMFCAQTMRTHAKSFYLSTRFLPRVKREAIEALYAFFRIVDDTVDEGAHPLAFRREKLNHCRNDVEGLSRPAYRSCAPWFPALQAAYADFDLDREPLMQLIDGCASDLEGRSIASFDELESYAKAVAGTVGRSVIPILGASDPDSLARAEQIGVAMQFTNILRDVEEDRAMGRNYLPAASYPDLAVADVMRMMALQAHERYEAVTALAPRLPNDGSRAALLMACAFYRNILRGVETRGFDPHAKRVYVSDAAKVKLAVGCVITAYTGFAIIR
ncbi:MAG TPA: phytoene/squalene synthase family protein [Candidatus Baltobacteraceae bacterium]|nr:phytoene/squalene synthase family protein [Candidatus Baltobacteraceae bacterium]